MATIHISEADAARDLQNLLAKVHGGEEVVIEGKNGPVTLSRSTSVPRRTLAECLALLPKDSKGVIDEDFAKDVQAGIDAHRESLTASTWD